MRTITRADLQAESLDVTTDGHRTRLEVLPRLGANLVSLQVDGRELIHFDPEALFAKTVHMQGCFQMFPSPCRLMDCRYTFQGREVHQRKHGQDYFIHGLVRDETFAIAKTPTELIATLEWDREHAVYEGFPWEGKLTTTFRVIRAGLEIHWAFENRADTAAPVGYGLHPFWKIAGDRAQTSVKVPADNRMELGGADAEFPSGKLLPVDGTPYDLRDWRSLDGLYMDDVYFPKPPGTAAGLDFRAEGLRLKITAADSVRHMICYAPEGRPFVCVENLTCAPDAQNLSARGFVEEAGLAVVEPGGKLEGWVRYEVEG